jgi:hypothetical protein
MLKSWIDCTSKNKRDTMTIVIRKQNIQEVFTLKKKLFLTAASAVLTVGLLAACGDDGLDEPTLGEDQDIEQEIEFDESEGTEEIETDVDAEVDETEEFDTGFDAETDETEEFDTELDAEIDQSDETEEDGQYDLN